MQHFIGTLTHPFVLRRPVETPEEARCFRAVSKDRRAGGIQFSRRIRRHTYEPQYLVSEAEKNECR